MYLCVHVIKFTTYKYIEINLDGLIYSFSPNPVLYF